MLGSLVRKDSVALWQGTWKGMEWNMALTMAFTIDENTGYTRWDRIRCAFGVDLLFGLR